MIPIVLILASCTFARVTIKTQDTSINLGINAAGWMETGQMKSFYATSGDPQSNQWLQRTFLDLGLDVIINERTHIVGGIEGEMWLNTPKGGASSQQYYIWRYNSSFIVDKAYASYSFGNIAAPFLTVTAGHFPYKYNPDVRNLGEYLFRSGTYPAYLINNFDLPYARLTGFKLSGNFLNNAVNLDGLLTFETDIPPYYDASISLIGSVDMHKIVPSIPLTLGAGVEFAHLISVDKSQTTPSYAATQYIKDGDTNYYTFKGTKIMARMCFDPKQFIPTTLFGPEDCKLYAEAAILGLENYPRNDSVSVGRSTFNNIWGYDTLAHKIPVTIGFNIPTFRMLDVLSLEVEWYGCPYPNSYAMELGKGNNPSLPLPTYYDRPQNLYTEDNWKWSVYAKKMFSHDRFGIVVQCARDHSRMQSLLDEATYWELEEAMSKNAQWYWMTKIIAQF
jgi:hypothetical protein